MPEERKSLQSASGGFFLSPDYFGVMMGAFGGGVGK